MILVGDIGGTKTNLALYEYEKTELKLQTKAQFASQEYASFCEVIKEFVDKNTTKPLQAICLGVAGPIIGGVCRTTNLPWIIDSKVLQETYKISNVKLLNDLEATAYGMLYLKEEEFVDINPDAKKTEATRAVIAAGTGLGEAILFYDGEKYHPMGTEGGHTDFAPQSTLEDELLVWMRKRFTEHVSVERLASGMGIYTIYEFLKEKDFAKEPNAMINLKEDDDKNVIITQCALEEKDALCLETMRIFVAIYGAEAGNLALKCLSLGGVYIGGGIAPKILPLLLDGNFLNAFVSKGRFKDLLQNMQIRVSLNPETALLGAAHFARDNFFKS